MNKSIITIIFALAAVCGGASAQPKISGRVPVREKRGYDQQIVIDTASVRILYALNAKDIKDEDTYIDLGKLEVGRRVSKYSSEFQKLDRETQWQAFIQLKELGASVRQLQRLTGIDRGIIQRAR
jgi:hypothetical protein